MKFATLFGLGTASQKLAWMAGLAGLLLAQSAVLRAQEVPTMAVTAQGGAQGNALGNVPGMASFMLDGVVQAVKQSTVGSQASGRIMAMAVKAGDKVRAGQLLATIDDREAQVGVNRSRAQVSQADAELRNAKVSVERTRDLVAKGFVSKAALDAAEAQYQSTLAQREQAQAGVSQAGLAQGYTRVTAPFDGWVLQTLAEAGDLAVPGKPLVTVYAPQPLRAVVQVPASRAQAVREAKLTRILVDGAAEQVTLQTSAQEITPVNRMEIPSSDPVSQTTEWRFDLPRAESAGLLPGQQIRARFSTQQSAGLQRILVPASALVRRGELTAVYVVSGNGFALRAVRVGAPMVGGQVELLAGVGAQDRIALDPLRAAAPGAAPAKGALK